MASAGDRVQIVIGAKDELSGQLRETRKELTHLGRTANDLQRRMESGEQGLQDEYEQTRREISRVTAEHKDLARQQAEVNREFRELTTNSRRAGDQMTRSMDRAGREMGIANSKADRLNRSSKTLAGGWAKMAGAAGAVTGAVVALGYAFRFLGDSVSEARSARKALAQTDAVLRSMGRTEAPEKIERMLDALSLTSGIDDDALREMSNVLLTFGSVTGGTFETANQLALDLSVAFGKDLRSSAVMVGKALNDPIKGLTALSRIGVQFTAEQQEQIKAMMDVNDVAGAQKIIMGELERQVGGSAEAQADAIDKTIVAWDNFKESVGEIIITTAGQLAGMGQVDPAKGLRKASKWIEANQQEIVSSLMLMAGWTLKFASATARMGSITMAVYGDLTVQLGGMIKALGWLGKSQSMQDFGQSLIDAGAQADQGSVGLGKLADGLDRLGNNALNAAAGLDLTRTSWQALKDAGVPKNVLDASRNIPLRFAGGPVDAGGTYMVGEIGPELFVPNVGSPRMVGQGGPEIRDFHASGTIVPSNMVTTYLAAQSAGGGVAVAQPSAGVHIENLTVQDRFDARREFDALTARQRRIDAERR